MFCAKCGAAVTADNAFCPKCGAPTQPSSAGRRKPSLGRIIVTSIILIVAGALIAALPGILVGGIIAIGYVVWAMTR